jgi:hypothetical protein
VMLSVSGQGVFETVSYTGTHEHVTQSTLGVKIPTIGRSSSEQRTVSY